MAWKISYNCLVKLEALFPDGESKTMARVKFMLLPLFIQSFMWFSNHWPLLLRFKNKGVADKSHKGLQQRMFDFNSISYCVLQHYSLWNKAADTIAYV